MCVQEVEINGHCFKIAVSDSQIESIITTLAEKINEDYFGKEVVFLVVLNGAFMFAADLLRKIEGIHKVCFIRLSTYEGTQSTGDYKEVIGITENLENKDVVIIEDIVDSGFTMGKLLERLKEINVRSSEICTLTFKPNNFKGDYNVKYVGMNIGDEFIVGYGLDLDQKGRNLKGIYQKK